MKDVASHPGLSCSLSFFFRTVVDRRRVLREGRGDARAGLPGPDALRPVLRLREAERAGEHRRRLLVPSPPVYTTTSFFFFLESTM